MRAQIMLTVVRIAFRVRRFNNYTHSWLEDQVLDIKKEIEVVARADMAKWHPASAENDFENGVNALLAQIRQRRTQLYQQLA
jgi:hypothetical protein